MSDLDRKSRESRIVSYAILVIISVAVGAVIGGLFQQENSAENIANITSVRPINSLHGEGYYIRFGDEEYKWQPSITEVDRISQLETTIDARQAYIDALIKKLDEQRRLNDGKEVSWVLVGPEGTRGYKTRGDAIAGWQHYPEATHLFRTTEYIGLIKEE